jgi:hypothetical protein
MYEWTPTGILVERLVDPSAVSLQSTKTRPALRRINTSRPRKKLFPTLLRRLILDQARLRRRGLLQLVKRMGDDKQGYPPP